MPTIVSASLPNNKASIKYSGNQVNGIELSNSTDNLLTIINPGQEVECNLEIIKKDTNGNRLSGVGFYLVKHVGENILYGRWDSNNSNTYTGVEFFYDFIDPNEPDKYVFKTGNNGNLVINGLDTADIFSVIELPGADGIKPTIVSASLPNNKAKISWSDDQVNGIELSNSSNILTITNPGTNVDCSLIVEKKGESGNLQPNVQFYLIKEINGTKYYGKWTNFVDSNKYTGVEFGLDYISENPEIASKQVFTTDSNGQFIVGDLNISDTYMLQEVSNPHSGYGHLDIKSATLNNNSNLTVVKSEYNPNNTNNLVTGIKLDSSKVNNELKIVDDHEGSNDPSQFKIIINKVNKSGNKIPGAQFRIKVKNGDTQGWLYFENPGTTNVNDYKYSIKNSYKEGTLWDTGTSGSASGVLYAKQQGVIEILNLPTSYEYEIYEFKAADNYYHLGTQAKSEEMKVEINGTKTFMNESNYKKIDEGDNVWAINCGKVSYGAHGSSVEVEVLNLKSSSSTTDPEYVDISGRVWLDKKRGKDNEYNSKYDSGEGLIGVKVYLKQIKNNRIIKYEGKDYITTNSSGLYEFDENEIKIKKSDLSKYFIYIEYEDIGKECRIVKYGSESKAKYQGAGSAWTDAINSSDREKMDIGLEPIPTETELVEKWVDNIKVIMKGHEYIYTVGEDNSNVGGGTNIGVGNERYYRTIYASDIKYSMQDGVTDGLQVFVTYQIRVSNLTSRYDKDKPKEDRQPGDISEVKMKVDITDKFDHEFYSLVEDENWKKGGEGVAKSKQTINLNRSGQKNDTKTIPITFKITKPGLERVLNEGRFTAGNEVTMSGKHIYEEYYQKRESADVYVRGWEEKSKSFEPQAAYAPGITFSIYEYDTDKVLERTISGKVFEDTNIKDDGQILGNGQYNDDESVIKDVKVELLQPNENKIAGDGEPATRYVYNKDSGEVVLKDNHETTFSEGENRGTYKFTGLIPGEYFIRFTYGDGTQKIISTDEAVYAYDYKSTIITNDKLKELIKDDLDKGSDYDKNDYYWYRDVSKNCSTAVDVLEDREKLNNQKEKTYLIRAYTPTFKISLENEDSNKTVDAEMESKREEKNKQRVYNIENINFGIIDTPKIQLGFEKKMTNIKVTNTQGNVIIDGNPFNASKNMKYLSNLDTNKAYLVEGSNYAKVEIKDKEIYGAKLEIEYSIKIINNSDVNYYEMNTNNYGYYYMFGETNSNTKKVNIEIKTVKDYLDNKLNFMGKDDHTHEILNLDNYRNEGYLQIKGSGTKLDSQKDKEVDDKDTEEVVKIRVTKILSNEDIDMNFESYALVSDMEVDGNDLIEDINRHQKETDKEVYGNELTVKYNNYFNYTKDNTKFANLSIVEKSTDLGADDTPVIVISLTIVPPTGADMATILMYSVVVTIAGIAITIGIIVIKKKVI